MKEPQSCDGDMNLEFMAMIHSLDSIDFFLFLLLVIWTSNRCTAPFISEGIRGLWSPEFGHVFCILG